MFIYCCQYFQQQLQWQSMKSKKSQQNKENCRLEQPRSQRQPPNTKGRSLTKRPQENKNKENYVNITETLDAEPQTYASKQFVLSRESLGTGSRSALKDLGVNSNTMSSQKSIEFKPYKQQQQLFDRRLSLKCTSGNSSQQLAFQNQKSQRLSMAPLRRDSVQIPQSMMDERQSLNSIYQNSTYSDIRSKQTLKKQTIITNLMSKLDHEENLRSIIELKLKNGVNMMSSSQSMAKKNQSYLTDYTDENNQQTLISKLKQCESQISYFKTVIREMSESTEIVELTEDKKFTKKKNNYIETPTKYPESQSLKATSKCQKCCRKNNTAQVAVQTTDNEAQKVSALNESYDFLDNLEKTLKVLGK